MIKITLVGVWVAQGHLNMHPGHCMEGPGT